MTVLVVVSTAEGAAGAVDYWNGRLQPQDRLFIVNLDEGELQQRAGYDIHPLQLDRTKRRSLPAKIVRRAARSIRGVHPFWNLILCELWQEFLWHVRCFDPDVVDLRWARGARALERRLRNHRWHVIGSEQDVPSAATINSQWRRYDPSVKVSVVLPVYNGEQYLRQAIDTCLNQTHRNLELVIVDDCSRDATPRIIEEYARRDSRVFSIRNPRNLRLPATLNVGFAATTGELLTWTSHDNYHEPTAIETLVRYLCTWPDVDFVYSAFRLITYDGHLQARPEYRPPPWGLLSGNVVGAYFLYRRAVYERVGQYRTDMEYVEDYDYWLRVYKSGFQMVPLYEPQYFYRHHSESMTVQASQMEEPPWDKVVRQHQMEGSLPG